MSADWYPAIRECCSHWNDAAMLHQTFQSFEAEFQNDNDACIDAAKSIVEAVCRLIVEELDDPNNPQRPEKSNPAFTNWVSSAIRVLKLGRNADEHVRDLSSAHNSLANALGKMRNDCGPASHGKPAFLDRLSRHHRHAAVLAADAIVALLHQAYLKADRDLSRTREPYEEFLLQHQTIDDRCVFLEANVKDDGLLAVKIAMPGGADSMIISALPSSFLFHLDRAAYVEALNASLSAPKDAPSSNEEAEAT